MNKEEKKEYMRKYLKEYFKNPENLMRKREISKLWKRNNKERMKKLREHFEDLRGHTDCFIVRVYWTIDNNGNVVLDEDSLKDDFEMRLRELKEILRQNS